MFFTLSAPSRLWTAEYRDALMGLHEPTEFVDFLASRTVNFLVAFISCGSYQHTLGGVIFGVGGHVLRLLASKIVAKEWLLHLEGLPALGLAHFERRSVRN